MNNLNELVLSQESKTSDILDALIAVHMSPEDKEMPAKPEEEEEDKEVYPKRKRLVRKVDEDEDAPFPLLAEPYAPTLVF
jgi:hypothetical protein